MKLQPRKKKKDIFEVGKKLLEIKSEETYSNLVLK